MTTRVTEGARRERHELGDSLLLLLFSLSKRLSPTPSVSNLSLRPGRYLSTVTQSLATFNSLSLQMRLEERSRMESRTIVCYLGGIWRRLEPLELIYGRFFSVDS